MAYVRTCSRYGIRMSRASSSEHRIESLDEYHRLTRLFPGGCTSVKNVKYSGTSWIAIRVRDVIFTVTHSESQEKHAKLDLFEICGSPLYNVVAVVSSILGNYGSGFAASSAEFNEKAASRFLKKALNKDETFTFEEAVQITVAAFRRLFPENIETNKIQFSVVTNDQQTTLPIEATEALLENERILTRFPTLTDTISMRRISKDAFKSEQKNRAKAGKSRRLV